MNKNTYQTAFYGLTSLFFMWGFITVMNDVLINSFEDTFHLSASQLSYIQLSFFGTFFFVSLAYYVLSNLTGRDPINKIGYKKGISISLIICAGGCMIALAGGLNASYPLFLIALLVISAGVTLLQICANPYATLLGPENEASGRLNLAQGLNSLGTTVGPIAGNILIYGVFSSQSNPASAFGWTYFIYGMVFLFLAIMVYISKFPEFKGDISQPTEGTLVKHKRLWFGVLAIFFYVGSEVAIGSWLGKFSKADHIMGFDKETANYYLAFFWGGLMIGRLMAAVSLNEVLSSKSKMLRMTSIAIGAFLLIWFITAIKITPATHGLSLHLAPIGISNILIYLIFILLAIVLLWAGKNNAPRILVIFSCVNVLLLFTAIVSTGVIAFWSLIGTGLFLSVGWSNIFALSIEGLGALKSKASSLLVMAIVGGAVLPWVQGQLIENYSIQLSFIVPLIGMLYLIFFGLLISSMRKSNA